MEQKKDAQKGICRKREMGGRKAEKVEIRKREHAGETKRYAEEKI